MTTPKEDAALDSAIAAADRLAASSAAVIAGAQKMSPLRREGSRFVNDAGPVNLIQGIVCCEKAKDNGWPFVSFAAMERMAASGINGIHIRLGPNGPGNNQESPSAEYTTFDAYEAKPKGHGYPWPESVFDLRHWNPAFWEGVHKCIDKAASLGMYAEVVVVDSWCLKHKLSPWLEGNDPSCQLVPARTWHLAWARKWALEVCAHSNVMVVLDNEGGLPPGNFALPWAASLIEAIRAVEKENGYVKHVIGCGAGVAAVDKDPRIDYIVRHQSEHIKAPINGRPSLMNETNPLSADQFIKENAAAKKAGTYYSLWRADMKDADWNRALAAVKKIQSEP